MSERYGFKYPRNTLLGAALHASRLDCEQQCRWADEPRSVEDAAARVGIHWRSLHAAENGPNLLTNAILVRLADLYRCDVGKLIEARELSVPGFLLHNVPIARLRARVGKTLSEKWESLDDATLTRIAELIRSWGDDCHEVVGWIHRDVYL
jgi:hypothetical protein